MRSFAGDSELTPAQLREAPIHWPRPSVLDVSLQALDGIGPKSAEAAAQAGIGTVWQLLMHLPHRHRDLNVRQLAELEVGESGTVRVHVLGSQPRPFRKGRLTFVSVKVGDDSGQVKATWFNQPWVAGKLTPGSELVLTGKRTNRGFAVNEWELAAAGPDEGGGGGEGAGSVGEGSERDGVLPARRTLPLSGPSP